MVSKDYQLKFDGFYLSLNERLLYRGDKIITLSTRAFDLLVLFAQNEGKVLLKEELLEKIWIDCIVEKGNLAVAINSLRKALKTDAGTVYIETFPKRGYRFNACVEKVPIQTNSKKDTRQLNTLSNLTATVETPTASVSTGVIKPFQILKSSLKQRKWLIFAIILVVLSFGFYNIAFSAKNQVNAMENITPENQKTGISY